MANRNIITRSGKGSDLDAADHDQNHNSFAGTVEEQTGTTYEVVYTDQNKTIELNNASMVCTLDAIADIHTAIDTNNFEVTLKNTNAAAATVQRSSTDTIEGATSITLGENAKIVLQTDSTGSTWSVNNGAQKGIVNAYTRQQYPAQQTLTDGANISWDLDSNQSAIVTLGGNRTLHNPTNMKAGASYILIIKQDATGSRTLSFGSKYKFAAGAAPTLTTTASAVDVLSFVSDGTNMLCSYMLDVK